LDELFRFDPRWSVITVITETGKDASQIIIRGRHRLLSQGAEVGHGWASSSSAMVIKMRRSRVQYTAAARRAAAIPAFRGSTK
jgi:hypothetical protein